MIAFISKYIFIYLLVGYKISLHKLKDHLADAIYYAQSSITGRVVNDTSKCLFIFIVCD